MEKLPRILDCSRHYIPKPVTSYLIGQRNCQHYELDYNISGTRTMMVDEKPYAVSEGCITCRRPGQVCASVGCYNMYMLTLEYTPLGDTDHRCHRLDNPVEPPCDSHIWDVIPTRFRPLHQDEIFAMYRRLSVIFRQPERREECNALLARLLHQITADAYAELCRIPERSAIDTLLEFFFENYPRRISLDEMAALVHLNKSYLVRLFRREIGQTPLDYLNGIRISSARELLHSTDLKVSEVAFRCGFESASYFIRRFSAACGETPEQYRLARPSENQ